MKCSEFLNELTNYLDGVLDARTKSELDDHLAWCHNCYVVCDTTKKTIEKRRTGSACGFSRSSLSIPNSASA